MGCRARSAGRGSWVGEHLATARSRNVLVSQSSIQTGTRMFASDRLAHAVHERLGDTRRPWQPGGRSGARPPMTEEFRQDAVGAISGGHPAAPQAADDKSRHGRKNDSTSPPRAGLGEDLDVKGPAARTLPNIASTLAELQGGPRVGRSCSSISVRSGTQPGRCARHGPGVGPARTARGSAGTLPVQLRRF